MASTKQIVHGIIHAASFACDEIDEDAAAIVKIQVTMIIAIASEHGIEVSNAAAVDLMHTFLATMESHPVQASRQLLVGWIPGIEDNSDDSTTAARTEAIGWTANSYFEQTAAK